MSAQTVTLSVGGQMHVAELARVSDALGRLLTALSEEAGAGTSIVWKVTGLDVSNGSISASAEVLDPVGVPAVANVLRAYLDVARRSGAPAFEQLVEEITASAGEHRAVVFETAEAEVMFTAPAAANPAPITDLQVVLSTVRGRVEAREPLNPLRFVLFDLASGTPASCYLQPGFDGMPADPWGRLVEVSGLLTRNPFSDKPMSVREVTSVELFDEPDPLAFRRARGAVKASADALASEVIIRRMRDAG